MGRRLEGTNGGELALELSRRTMAYDSFDRSLQGIEGRTILTARESSDWTIDGLRFGGSMLQVVQEGGASFYEGAASPDHMSLVVSLPSSGALSLGGSALEDAWMMVVRPGDPVVSHGSEMNRWAGMTLPTDEFAAIVQRLDDAQGMRLLEGSPSLPIPRSSWSRITDLVERARNVAGLESAAARALFEDLTHAFVGTAVDSPGDSSTTGRPAIPRTRVVERVREWLEPSAHRDASVASLARVAGVSERTLRNVFLESFGTTPKRFLILRQLHAVRAELLRASRGDTVTAIAGAHDMWDLGRFAARYRKLFGEAPSETLARSAS